MHCLIEEIVTEWNHLIKLTLIIKVSIPSQYALARTVSSHTMDQTGKVSNFSWWDRDWSLPLNYFITILLNFLLEVLWLMLTVELSKLYEKTMRVLPREKCEHCYLLFKPFLSFPKPCPAEMKVTSEDSRKCKETRHRVEKWT